MTYVAMVQFRRAPYATSPTGLSRDWPTQHWQAPAANDIFIYTDCLSGAVLEMGHQTQ